MASQLTHLCTPKGNFGALLRNWANMMAKHRLMEAKSDSCEFCKNEQNHFIKLIAKVGTMFFGITSNPSMYTQVEFWGITQELGQHGGQTLPG